MELLFLLRTKVNPLAELISPASPDIERLVDQLAIFVRRSSASIHRLSIIIGRRCCSLSTTLPDWNRLQSALHCQSVSRWSSIESTAHGVGDDYRCGQWWPRRLRPLLLSLSLPPQATSASIVLPPTLLTCKWSFALD